MVIERCVYKMKKENAGERRSSRLLGDLLVFLFTRTHPTVGTEWILRSFHNVN
eukprot:COSAG01_NODE_5518_length_4207_cov_14.979796_8_plen_53_part_00